MGDVVGTLHYISPDMISQNYDEKTDIWSLGVSVYLILFGRLPYTSTAESGSARKEREVIQAIMKDAEDFLDRVSRRLDTASVGHRIHAGTSSTRGAVAPLSA